MLEAAKGFRRLKAHKQLADFLRTALAAHQAAHVINLPNLNSRPTLRSLLNKQWPAAHGSNFNRRRDIPIPSLQMIRNDNIREHALEVIEDEREKADIKDLEGE